MADRLATPADLETLLGTPVDADKAGLMIEIGTAIVQEAAGPPGRPQRLIAVAADPFTVPAPTGPWLTLPERPVTAVSAIEIDGTAVTAGTGTEQYRLVDGRLWRRCGWSATWEDTPSLITGVYDHGWPDGHQRLQLARGAVLSMIQGGYGTPAGLKQISIDDYTEVYNTLSGQLDGGARAALYRAYGPLPRLGWIG